MKFLFLVVPVALWVLPILGCLRTARKWQSMQISLKEFPPYRISAVVWIPVYNWVVMHNMRKAYNEMIRNTEVERFEEFRVR